MSKTLLIFVTAAIICASGVSAADNVNTPVSNPKALWRLHQHTDVFRTGAKRGLGIQNSVSTDYFFVKILRQFSWGKYWQDWDSWFMIVFDNNPNPHVNKYKDALYCDIRGNMAFSKSYYDRTMKYYNGPSKNGYWGRTRSRWYNTQRTMFLCRDCRMWNNDFAVCSERNHWKTIYQGNYLNYLPTTIPTRNYWINRGGPYVGAQNLIYRPRRNLDILDGRIAHYYTHNRWIQRDIPYGWRHMTVFTGRGSNGVAIPLTRMYNPSKRVYSGITGYSHKRIFFSGLIYKAFAGVALLIGVFTLN